MADSSKEYFENAQNAAKLNDEMTDKIIEKIVDTKISCLIKTGNLSPTSQEFSRSIFDIYTKTVVEVNTLKEEYKIARQKVSSTKAPLSFADIYASDKEKHVR